MSADFSRRDFIRLAALGSATATAVSARPGYAAGSDTIRLGVIGAGGRGEHDTKHCLRAAEGIELVAVADAFKDRADACVESIRKAFPDKVKVTPETTFSGIDAYEQLLKTDVDLVILTTPPFFRPMHLKAAVEAGKHVFMEKPVAVDPVGVRSIIASSEQAEQKNLVIVAGTQARRMNHRIELMKRIHDGEIGELRAVECIRTGDGMLDWGGIKERPADMTDMEWQVRRWLFYTWLSGDFIAEMHVHELDIVNWGVNGVPVKCFGMGGRQVRTDPLYGNVYDHFSADYEYANGVHVQYLGCQITGASDNKTYERFICSNGIGYTGWEGSRIDGPKPWKYEGKDNDPVIQQFADLAAAIRGGQKLNEGRRIAESSLTAILGRMSAYTGREIKFEWALEASKLDLSPPKLELGPLPPAEVAVPGKTPLV